MPTLTPVLLPHPKMRKIGFVCALVVGMIACTERNTPVDSGSTNTGSTDTTVINDTAAVAPW